MIAQIVLDDRGSGRDEVELRQIPVVRHLVTLVNPRTGEERTVLVETMTDLFCDVWREVCDVRVERGLVGWEIYEALQLGTPF